MKYPFYIFSSGRLRRKDNTIFFEPFDLSEYVPEIIEDDILASFGDDIAPDWVIKKNEKNHKEKRVIPIETIESFFVFSELTFSTHLLEFLAKNEIVMHTFNKRGFYNGTYYPREHLVSGELFLAQVKAYQTYNTKFYLSCKLQEAAAYNILKNIRYYHTRGIDFSEEIEKIEKLAVHFPHLDSIDKLMLNEAQIRKIYYTCFDRILSNKFLFDYRSKNPPLNPVNALISFGNTLCYTSMLSEIYRTQLNPAIGFLHSVGTRRFTLALDLSEIFKPILVDRMIFKLINSQQIQSKHFTEDLEGCYLNEEGRKIVVKAWDDRLRTTIMHRSLKKHVSYRQLMRLNCYNFIRFLISGEPFEPFRIWW